MTTSLADIRFIVERDIQDSLDDASVINWCNTAQTDFMLRIYIPDSTTLVIDTVRMSYPLSADIREIRRIRRQSDITNSINRPYNPVYTLYDGNFEVPAPFGTADTLLIDFYRYLTFFTDTDDLIDLQDRFFPLFTSFIEMRYYRLLSTVNKVGAKEAESKYQSSYGIYSSTKKQVANAYNLDIGVQKPKESGF